MPRITISEKDLTINNEVNITENLVFIPGISSKEVTGTPKRYDNAEDFINDFGMPYKFISKQEYTDSGNSNTIEIIAANEYDRSCIYAIELLTAGYSIYFNNIINTNDYVRFTTVEATANDYKNYKVLTPNSAVTESTFEPYTYLIAGESSNYKYATSFENGTSYYSIATPSAFSGDATYVNITSDTGIIQAFYNALMTATNNTTKVYNPYQKVLDRWTYNVKFITTGGYSALVPVTDTETKAVKYPVAETVLMAAAARGDALALIDDIITNDLLTTYDNINNSIGSSIFNSNFNGSLNGEVACNIYLNGIASRLPEDTRKYGQVIAPAGTYYTRNSALINNKITSVNMQGSFGYLLALVNSIEVLRNPDYYAIAGVSRGQVPNLRDLIKEPTGAEGEEVQSRTASKLAINPILFVQNYDYCIWGNRTLFPNPAGDLAASSFANIRMMSADVKKVIYQACKELTFETNSVELWLKFKSKVEPILEQMVSNNALTGYTLLKKQTNQKATLSVYVALESEYPVEDFEITIGLTDTTVEEVE